MPETPSGTATKNPFRAFAVNAQEQEVLRAFAEKNGLDAAGVMAGDAAAAADYFKSNPSPALLLVEVPSAEAAPALLEQLAEVCDANTKVIVIGDVNEYSFFCWLTELGVSSYLLKPLDLQALTGAYAKAMAPPAASREAEKKLTQVIGVLGTRGGAGATSIAIYLAALVAGEPRKTALVDLDAQDGSISLLLDAEPSKGVREALERPDRIDAFFLDRSMQPTAHNFKILSAEEGLHERIHYHEMAADTLMAALKEQFDTVVLDLPRKVDAFYRACLKECGTIFVVTERSLPGLRESMRLNDLFRDTLRLKPPVFVANHVGRTPRHEMSAADFDKGLGAKVDYAVPFAPDIFMQISGELPALKNKSAPALKVLQQMAGSVVPEALPAPEEGKKKGLSLRKKGK